MKKIKKQEDINKKLQSSPKKHTYDVLILDAETRQSLVAIRSLGRKGLRVAAMGNFGKHSPAFSSKWCSLGIIAPFEEGTIGYIKYLLDFLQKNKVTVVIPCSDGTIAILRKYRKQIQKLTHVSLASETAVAIAINKNKTLAAAGKLGIKVPKSVTVSRKEQIAKALEVIGLPVVIKPAESWTQGKLGRKRVCPELVTTQEEAYDFFTSVTQFGGATIFQQYIPGKREAVSFLYANKTIYARFAQLAIRTQPPLGGTSVLRQSTTIPKDIGIQAEKLLREIHLEGYSEVEFRRDNKGVPYFMEINPRLSASVEIAIHAHIDFPYLLYQWASGEKINMVTQYQKNVWERYLAGDIITTIQALQQKGRPGVKSQREVLFDFFRTFFQPMKYDYLDWHDILPAWKATNDLFLRNMKKLFTKGSLQI